MMRIFNFAAPLRMAILLLSSAGLTLPANAQLSKQVFIGAFE